MEERIWFIEASIIVIGVIYYSVKDQSCKVFCENCATWCKIAKGFDLVGQIELDSLKRATEAKNFSYLEKLSLKPNQVNSWLNLYIRKCPNCENTNTLSISEINRETNFQGKTSIKEKDLLINLLVSSKEVSKIEEICDKAQKYSNAN